MPITEQGFQKYTYSQLLEQQITRAKDLFGQDVDTSEQSVLGKYIRLIVSDFAQQEESLEQVYLSRYIDTAYGISLDRLAPFAGITRNAATYATVKVLFKNDGDTTATVGMGTKLVSASGVLYHTTEVAIIDAGESKAVLVECDESGTIGNVVTSMQFYNTQIPNVTVTVQTATLSVGAETETDADLRARWKKAIAGSGSGTANAIMGAVSRVDGVRDCIVYENDTDENLLIGADALLPPHCFMTVVIASESQDAEIAEAIFSRKPIGIQSYGGVGSTTVEVHDIAGNMHSISFKHAIAHAVKVRVTLSESHLGTIGDDKKAEIQESFTSALETYFNSRKIAERIHANAFYTPLLQTGVVSCIESIQAEIGDSGWSEEFSTQNATVYYTFGGLTLNIE